MCGIAGIFHFNGAPPDEQLIRRMVGIIPHRGPDETGVYCDAHVGLGHARLSIVDLATGQQPMPNADKTIWLTFNGEIFNFIELRDELLAKGHCFTTKSDTEVLIKMYEEYGEDCVRHFNGQWAFALWDSRKQKLFLSRDRLGVRPLHYSRVPQGIVFGSEIKSILLHPLVSRELDLEALDQTLTFWSPTAPHTIIKKVLELPPGHSLVLHRGEITLKEYWQPNYTDDAGLTSERYYAERLLELLVDATRIRLLRADVPVGAYLSGGLDSTVITSIIKRYTDTPLRTFSIGFDDPEFDESAYQQQVVNELGTSHSHVRCSYDDIGRVFPEVVWLSEKPLIRTAPAPMLLLSKLVRDSGYKVVLTGEGSDEMLGGYDIFKEAKIRRFWGRATSSKWRPLLLKRLYPWMEQLHKQSDAYLKAFFHVRDSDLNNPFFSHLPRWDLTAKAKNFYSANTASALSQYDARQQLQDVLPEAYSTWPTFCQAQYLEMRYLLPGYILSSQGDRMGMGNSIEGRFPFLDNRVVEFAMRIPPKFKMKVLNEKYILKLAAQDIIPSAVKKRPKQPYRSPDAKSFYDAKTGKARHAYVDELLSRDAIARDGIFNPLAVEKLANKARTGQLIGVKDNMALVGILSTQLIMDKFINNFARN